MAVDIEAPVYEAEEEKEAGLTVAIVAEYLLNQNNVLHRFKEAIPSNAGSGYHSRQLISFAFSSRLLHNRPELGFRKKFYEEVLSLLHQKIFNNAGLDDPESRISLVCHVEVWFNPYIEKQICWVGQKPIIGFPQK